MIHPPFYTALFLWASSLFATVTVAGEMQTAESLFARHCAVCHGADRGGYIGPALNRDETRLSAAQVEAKIRTGGVGTLMPRHPVWWTGELSRDEVKRLARLVTTQPKRAVSWGLPEIAASLEVFIADEASLPARPVYAIADIDDLMAVAARGEYAAGDAARVIFFDGHTNQRLGHVRTGHAPHLVEFHPKDARWAYVRTDAGYVLKVDLYSMQVVRKIRAGLNGTSLAVSRDGRYLAAGSFVPDTAVILDATTLEPVKLLALEGVDPDGRPVEADSGMIISTPYADYFVIALEQAGQVWIVDLAVPDMPVSKITQVGRHLHDAFLSPGGRHLLVSSYDDNIIAVVDLKTREVVKRIPAGCKPHLGSGAVVQAHGRSLGIGTNIGVSACDPPSVTVFDMETFEVVKQIKVLGPTESPAVHAKAPYIVVDIVGTGSDARMIQLIDKETLEIAKTIQVGGHSHFPEYTARGEYLYVSAGYGGDRLVIYEAQTFDKVKTFKMEVPAGVFSRARSRMMPPGVDLAGG